MTVTPAAAAHGESVNGLGHKEAKRLLLLSGRQKQKAGQCISSIAETPSAAHIRFTISVMLTTNTHF